MQRGTFVVVVFISINNVATGNTTQGLIYRSALEAIQFLDKTVPEEDWKVLRPSKWHNDKCNGESVKPGMKITETIWWNVGITFL